MSKSASSENSEAQAKFSLLSWLGSIILYGSVFASFFLPSYVAQEFDVCRGKHFIGLSSSCSARRVEARNNIGAINRAQQAFYLENNRFADSIKEAGVGIQTETDNYSYRIIQPMTPVQELNQSGSSNSEVLIRMAIAQGKKSELVNYLGVVYTVPDTSASGETKIITRAILCEMTKKPLSTTIPTIEDGDMRCPHGYKNLGE
jgi:type II secretory pathway pseudopilin PulG